MQTNLKSLFAGKREVIEVAPKRGPGRPRKIREQADEEPDAVLLAVENQANQPEAYEVDLRGVRNEQRRRWSRATSMQVHCEAAGKPVSELRMPGCTQRSNRHEGPQKKLALCLWMHKMQEDIGGTDEAWENVVEAVATVWEISKPDVVRIYEAKDRWQEECEERGVTAHGLKNEEAQLPRYLRKSRFCTGVVSRARGGGRIDKLRFLYPLAKDYFETMRQYGKYIDAVDLEDYLRHCMQKYLDEASKPGVAQAIEDAPLGSRAGQCAARVEVVKLELERLKDAKLSDKVHEHRQQMLMRFCGARLRKPQRLTTLTLTEERGRWECTLQAYDRLLWEVMRPEFLREKALTQQRTNTQQKNT